MVSRDNVISPGHCVKGTAETVILETMKRWEGTVPIAS